MRQVVMRGRQRVLAVDPRPPVVEIGWLEVEGGVAGLHGVAVDRRNGREVLLGRGAGRVGGHAADCPSRRAVAVRGLGLRSADTGVGGRLSGRLGAGTAGAWRGCLVTSVLVEDGDLVLDPEERTVTRSGRALRLTAREFDLLRYLVTHPDVVLSREDLLREVWGWSFGDDSTVTVHVRRLREKIEDDPGSPTRLVTVWGVGYRWDPSPAG